MAFRNHAGAIPNKAAPPYQGCYLRNSTVNQEASNETVITNDLAYSAVNVTGD